MRGGGAGVSDFSKSMIFLVFFLGGWGGGGESGD